MAHPKSGYKNAAGEKVPGVTTVIGRFKDSGALMYWACEQGKAIERGEIERLYDKRDAAAESGTLAHSMVEAHIAGDPQPTLENAGVPVETFSEALKAYGAYLNWESMTNIRIVEQELRMVSELYQFGGCPDAIGEINGELCLLDWKTSSGSGVYVDYLLQLAAYKQLWDENHPDRPITGGFHLCKFSKTGAAFGHHYYQELDLALEQFLLLLKAYKNDKVLSKRV